MHKLTTNGIHSYLHAVYEAGYGELVLSKLLGLLDHDSNGE